MGARMQDGGGDKPRPGEIARKDCRLRMSREVFDALEDDPNDPAFVLYTELIQKNPEIPDSLRGELTAGQNKFLRLLQFDWLVCDGGIEQFFLCQPFDIIVVGNSLRDLWETELHDLYNRAVSALIGEQGDWEVLKTGVLSNGDSPEFRQFDKAYHERSAQDPSGRWVIVQVGLRKPFLRRLAAFVRANPEEFITG